MTNDTTPLLLLTTDPSQPLAHLALRYARAYLTQTKPLNTKLLDTKSLNNGNDNFDHAEDSNQRLNVFFYADAAHTASRLRWQSAEQLNLTQQWQKLAEQYQLALPVCVSTALSRGITDPDNSQRHQLEGDNLAAGFTLVGLSELALMMQNNCRLIQF